MRRQYVGNVHVFIRLIGLILIGGLILPQYAFAAPTLSTNETAANVAASTVPSLTFAGGVAVANSTVPTITFSGGVNGANTTFEVSSFGGGSDEYKASLTIFVNDVVSQSSETFQVGDCSVNLVDTGPDEFNCNDNNATIQSEGLGTSELGDAILSLTNVNDSSHGLLDVSGGGGSITFTTSGTETSTSEIYFVDTGFGDIVYSGSNPGQILQTATASLVIDNALAANATDHSITIDGTTIDLGTSALTTTQIADVIAATDFSGASGFGDVGGYTVQRVNTNTVVFTLFAAGEGLNGYTLQSQDDTYTAINAVAASVTITITGALAANATDHSVQIDSLTAIDLGTSALTASQVAAAIRSGITGAAGYGAKTYTVSGSGTNIIFTRKSTGAAGNGALTINDGSYTATNAVAATASSIIPAGLVANAGDHSVTIDGVTINLGTSVLTAAQVAAAIAAATYTSGTSYLANGAYTAGSVGSTLTLTRSTGGTGGNNGVTIADASYGITAQVVTFTPGSITAGYSYTITINGTDYTYTSSASPTVQEIVEGLKPLVDANAAVTCTEDDTKVTCTADTAGTAFTYATNVTAVASSGGGETTITPQYFSSGGGGGYIGNTSYLNYFLPAPTIIQQPQDIYLFIKDLTLGSDSSEVFELQKYLNSHGFVLALTGPGSPGHETTYFGALTKKALIKFQFAHNITPSIGYFGPKTKAFIKTNPALVQ